VKRFDFFTSMYFPLGFVAGGAVLFAFGLLIVFVQLWVGVILILIGLVTISTHYRLSFDLSNRTYRDYVWFLGVKVGPSTTFRTIEYFFIKTGRESQTMNMRVVSSTMHKDVFDGFLKFSETDKLHVLTRDSQEAVLRKLMPMSQALNVPIMDYTQSAR
jgi:hypothetical protein